MRLFSFPTRCLALFVAATILSACAFDGELRQFRNTIPKEIPGLAWPSLSPIGDFAPNRQISTIPDPRSLAQRAVDLRQRSRSLRGPVLEPARERAMRAALERYYQG